jgi:hypothetical protein
MAIRRLITPPGIVVRDGSLFSMSADQTTASFSSGAASNLGIADDWSVSFWAKNTDETDIAFRVFERGEVGGANQLVVTRSTGDSETLRINTENSTSGILKRFSYNGVWTTGDWRHVVFTWTGNDTMLCYVDGVLTEADLKSNDNLGTMDNPGAVQNVGLFCKQLGGTRSWYGSLGHSAIWDVVLDQNDVDEIFSPTAGSPFGLDLLANTGTYDKSANLIQYWKPGFDDTDVMKNYSIDGDAITFLSQTRNANEIHEDTPGNPAQFENFSVALDGSTEYYNTPIAHTTWGLVETFSVSFWAKSVQNTANSFCVEWEKIGGSPANEDRFAIWYNGSDANDFLGVALYDGGGTHNIIKNLRWYNIFDDLQWHHILCTFDGTDTGDPFVMYIDGVLTAPDDSITDTTGTRDAVPLQCHYGQNQNNSAPWEGNLGHLGMWDVVLDQNDVDQIFADKLAIDLRDATGTYDKQASIQHYYRPGWNWRTPQYDRGVGTTIDLAAVNLNVTNIVEDAP